MRPGLVFVGLLAVLLGFYALVADTLGNILTFGLQTAIVVLLLAGSIWFRRSRAGGRWRLFQEEPPTEDTASADEESLPKPS